MAKHVTKANERAWQVSVKMAESKKYAYKNQQRRDARAKVRQALFVSEYLLHKDFELYQQATDLFREINEKYPTKPDLRKSIEFKNWQREQQGLPKIRPRQKRKPRSYPPIYDTSNDSTRCVQCVPEAADLTQIINNVPKKVMVLKIPLLTPQPKTSPQEVCVDEVVNEGDIEPLLFDNISPQTMENLMAELRADPDIANIMDDLEKDLGFISDEELNIDHPEITTVMTELDEELGMELEIDDRLEKELEDMLFW